MKRCPKCNRPLMCDPAYPRALRPGPADWCWFHGGVIGRWLPTLGHAVTPEEDDGTQGS